jgi:MoxR-like ATPase
LEATAHGAGADERSERALGTTDAADARRTVGGRDLVTTPAETQRRQGPVRWTGSPRDGSGDGGGPEASRGFDAGGDLATAIGVGQAMVENLGRVLLGAREAIEAAVIAALAGGHLLIEDVPGVGKTVLARALAISLGAELSRVQGHPDLLPSDVTGVSVFSPDTSTWEFRPGPVFAHVVLFDELNRTPPRTQSALLETMEEHQVSVDGESWPLPRPHMVVATQNPLSQRGTFPLVESQLDRFALATPIGYPDAADETHMVLHEGGTYSLAHLAPVCTLEGWQEAQRATENVGVASAVAEYAVAICRASRTAPGVRVGASPRAAIWLIRAAQAHAVLSARTYVVPTDVKAVAVSCLAHRILVDDGDEGIGQASLLVRELLDATPTPRP